MKYNKMPGGESQGMEKKDFSKEEQQAIDKGSKIEKEEHGNLAPEEIAADHVKESGSKYYDDKKGLPAMEKKLEQMNKADPRIKPAEISDFTKVAYDPDLSPEEHKERVKHHNKMAGIESSKGNKESAMWHLQQGHKHYKALMGNPPPLPEHVIKSESLAKDVVDIKTGKKLNATKKRIEVQPAKPSLDVKLSAPKQILPKVSVNQPQKTSISDIKTLGSNIDNDEQRKQRIRNSLEKINNIISELRGIKAYSNSKKMEDIKKSKEQGCRTCGSKTDTGEHVQCQNCEDADEVDHESLAEKNEHERDIKMNKSIKYASGGLSKGMKGKCSGCGCQEHNQWVDSSKKSESCQKCGTPMKKSGLPEEMPTEVRRLSKSENIVFADEYFEFKNNILKKGESPNLLQKPPKSEAQRRAMGAAAQGESTLGIPKKVGKEFIKEDLGGKLPEKIKKNDQEGEKSWPRIGNESKTQIIQNLKQRIDRLKNTFPMGIKSIDNARDEKNKQLQGLLPEAAEKSQSLKKQETAPQASSAPLNPAGVASLRNAFGGSSEPTPPPPPPPPPAPTNTGGLGGMITNSLNRFSGK